LALLALFVALGGTAWAGSQIKSGDIAKNAVRSKHIKKNQVKTADVKDGGVTSTDLGAGAVDTAKLAPDAATGDKVQESTLGKVPAAASADSAATAGSADNAANADNAAKLEGAGLSEIAVGRSNRDPDGCFPAAGFTDCVSVEVTMARQHRLLLVAAGEVFTSTGTTDSDIASCRLEIDDVALASSHNTGIAMQNATGSFFPNFNLAHTQVTGVLAPGTHRADLACTAASGQPGIGGAEISAVALGAG
jgi:hypothetical protein